MTEGRMYQLKVLAYLTILWVGSAAADSPFTSAPAPNLNEVLNGFHNDDANTVRMGVRKRFRRDYRLSRGYGMGSTEYRERTKGKRN